MSTRKSLKKFIFSFLGIFWFLSGVSFFTLKLHLIERYVIEDFLSGTWGAVALYCLGTSSILISGYFILSSVSLYREQRGFVRQDELGKVQISPYAVEEMAHEILRNHFDISSYRISLSQLEEGILIVVKASVRPDTDISETSEEVQKLLRDKIMSQTGLTVERVDFYAQGVKGKEERTVSRKEPDEDEERREGIELSYSGSDSENNDQEEGEING